MHARRETPIDRDQFALWPLFVDNSRFVRLELWRDTPLGRVPEQFPQLADLISGGIRSPDVAGAAPAANEEQWRRRQLAFETLKICALELELDVFVRFY